MNRRDVLKGLAALPLVGLIRPCRHELNPVTLKCVRCNTTKFNIIVNKWSRVADLYNPKLYRHA